MISGASLQIWSVSVGHKLVVWALRWQERVQSWVHFDCRCYLQLRMGKNNILCFRQAIWQLRKIAIYFL